MQTDNYKRALMDSLENLIKINESIFSSIIDITMQGELRDWNNTVPIGEVHQFDFALFKSSDDTNINLLVELVEKVDKTYETIKNINSIQLDE